jgi:hypothetical protein
MVLTNFQLFEITETKRRDDLNGKLANPGEFVQTRPNVWIASFDVDGVPYHAGIRLGHRIDVAEDIEQYDVQLRVRDEEFDSDSFIPEASVADITKLVGEQFEKRIVKT